MKLEYVGRQKTEDILISTQKTIEKNYGIRIMMGDWYLGNSKYNRV